MKKGKGYKPRPSQQVSCQNCGTSYSTTRGWSRYCSKPCRSEWWKKALQAGRQVLTPKVDWGTVKLVPADPELYQLSLNSGNDPKLKKQRTPRKAKGKG